MNPASPLDPAAAYAASIPPTAAPLVPPGAMSPMLATTFVEPSPEAKAAYLAASNFNFTARTTFAAAGTPGVLVGVAEGDSWFDYLPAFLEPPFAGDLLAHLHHTGRFNILNVAKAGDTLQNMAFGTDVQSNGQPQPAELLATLDAVRLHQPDFLLLSAGGNDLSGSNGVYLETFLNHATTGLPPLRERRAQETFGEFNRAALQYLVNQVHAVKADVEIFIHGYDYTVPDGRPVLRAPLGFNFIGPWLLPAFARQRIWPPAARQQVINRLVDLHNATIADLAATNPKVHHIDCRGVLRNDPQTYTQDWANELHPTPSGFGKIATRFVQVIAGVFNLPAAASAMRMAAAAAPPPAPTSRPKAKRPPRQAATGARTAAGATRKRKGNG